MKHISITLKFFAVFLVLAFCLQILPQTVLRSFATEALTQETDQQVVAPADENIEFSDLPREPEEIVAKRTETTKHFRMPDGMILAADYAMPVHYEKDGTWTDIDNTLNPSEGEYVSQNDVTIRFAENGNTHKLVELHKDDYNVRFGLSSSAKSSVGTVVNPGNNNDKTHLIKLVSGVYYPEVLDHVDLEYQLIGTRIKENIIIKEPLESYTFAFDLKLQNLSAELQEDGGIALKDGEDILWFMPAPFAYDADGTETTDVFYTLAQKGNSDNYTLTVTLSSEWVQSAKFPVVIDPNILKQGSAGIASFVGTRAGVNSYYLSGETDTIDVTVKPLSEIGVPSRALISKAELIFPIKTAPQANVTVGAREIVNGEVNSALASKADVSSISTFMKLDVTALAKDWHESGVRSVRLSQTQYTAGSCEMSVYDLSADYSYRPKVQIFYYDSVGLEEYFTYSEFDLSSASLFVKHATGQATAVVSCLTPTKPLSIVTVSAVYNTDIAEEYDPEQYFYGLPGNGWSFSNYEYLVYKSGSYIYLDGDGTAHYFTGDGSGGYYDEDGLGLTLTVDSYNLSATITSKEDYVKIFNRSGADENSHYYYLQSERSPAGQSLQYSYNQSGDKVRIYEITALTTGVDEYGIYEDSVESVAFSYNSNGTPYRIYHSVSGTRYQTNLNYNSAGELFAIVNLSVIGSSTGVIGTTRFQYADGRLSAIYNDASRYNLTYANDRVSSVQNYGRVNLSNTAGATVGFEYQPGFTTVRTGGADDIYNNADDLFTSYIYDQYGRTTASYSRDNNGKVFNASSYEYTAPTGSAVNYKRHKLYSSVYGGANTFYSANQTSGSVEQNLLSDSSFETDGSWTLTAAQRTSEQAKYGTNSLKITANGKASQTYTGATYQGKPKVFLISGWAKADSMNTADTGAAFALRAKITYNASLSGTAPETFTRTVDIPFQWLCDEWQYVAGSFIVESKPDIEITSIESITVECVYENNVNTAYFDGVTLTAGVYQNVDYDNKGNVTATRSSVGSDRSYSYDNENRLVSASRNKADGTSESASYSYSSGFFNRNITSADLPLDLHTEYTYNGYGQVRSSEITSTAEGVTDSSAFRTEQTYTSEGFVFKTYDTTGNTSASYYYANQLISSCNADGILTNYEYNPNETLARTYIGGIETSDGVLSSNAPVTYTYNEYDALLLEKVSTTKNSFTFSRNAFGNLISLRSGNTNLVTYTYQQGYGKLASMTYANGYSEQYGYNAQNLLSAIYRNGAVTPSFVFSYDDNGNLLRNQNNLKGYYTDYSYDTLSRVTGYTHYTAANVPEMTTAVTYDAENRTSGLNYTLGSTSLSYVPTYGEADRLENWSITNRLTRALNYDYLHRLNNVSLRNAGGTELFKTTYSFRPGWNGTTGYSSDVVNAETNSALNETLSYEYDSVGRVIRVLRNGQLINKYTYDSVTGFLIREDNADAGISYTYTYDTVGNILSRRSYSFTVGDLGEEIEYTAKEWNYIGINFYGIGERSSSFYYDAMGNVTWDFDTSYTWNGRELTSYFSSDVLHYYSYNSDGIRTDKVREEYGQITETVHYVLDGSTIVSETRKDGYDTVTHQFYYYYDENGAPIGLNWNGQDYYYYKNIFGDILGIFNSAGTLVVRYSYDAWGNSISRSGSMANTLGIYNPFRYRGYYYDNETGMYYLNARYYNPYWCRFISPDPVLDASNAVGCNLFVYCNNSPVCYFDLTGEDAIWLQDKDAVGGLGHSGLLLQDENGQWLHFYWGSNRGGFSGKTGSYEFLEPYGGDLSFEGINKHYSANDPEKGYEKMIYFEGDFSGSISYIYDLQRKNFSYDLLYRNCVQVTKRALLRGNFKKYDFFYKKILKEDNALIPNLYFNHVNSEVIKLRTAEFLFYVSRAAGKRIATKLIGGLFS